MTTTDLVAALSQLRVPCPSCVKDGCELTGGSLSCKCPRCNRSGAIPSPLAASLLAAVTEACGLCNRNASGDPWCGGKPGYTDDGHCPWCGGTAETPGTGRIPLAADDERLVTRLLTAFDAHDYHLVLEGPKRFNRKSGMWRAYIGHGLMVGEAEAPTAQEAALAAVGAWVRQGA